MTSFFKTTVLAALAFAGVASLSSIPTQAATTAVGAPALSTLAPLQIGLTPEMVTRGKTLQDDMVKFGYDEDDVDEWCAGKGDIRDGLIRAGFSGMDVIDRMNGFRLRVEALYLSDGWYYSMLVNRCTGEVSVLSPIYAASDID
jgi:hypothetical protein